MIYSADTNVLLRFAGRSHALHPVVRSAVRTLKSQGHRIHTLPQNCVEFWNVATRPQKNNGFGLTPDVADRMLRLLERLFPIQSDSPLIYQEWRRLVVNFKVSGVQIHDTRIAAALKTHGITHLLTFNNADFLRFAPLGIIAVNPLHV